MEDSPPRRLSRSNSQDQTFKSSMNGPPHDYFSGTHSHPENQYRQPYYEDDIEGEVGEEGAEEERGDHRHETSKHGTPQTSPTRRGNGRTRSLSPFSEDARSDPDSSEGDFSETINPTFYSGTMAERAERDGLSMNVPLTAVGYILGDGVVSPSVQVWSQEKTDLKDIGITHLHPIHALEYRVNEMGEGKVVLFCPQGPPRENEDSETVLVRWLHVKRHTMSLKVLDKLVRNCPLIDHNLREVAVKLIDTVGHRFVRDSENGTYIEPGSVLRSIGVHPQDHNNQVSSKPQQTDPVIFIASPYLVMRSLENCPTSEDGEHHPQTLLQSLYGFDVVTNRDKHQVIRKMSACAQKDDALYVSQMWCLLIGSNILITMSDQPSDDLLGSIVEKRTSGLEQPIIVRIIDQANHIHRILVPTNTSWVDFFRYTMVMVQGKVDDPLNFELIDQENGILTGEKWIEFMKSKMPRLHVFRLVEKKRPDLRHRGHIGRGSSFSNKKEVLMLDYQPRSDDTTDRDSTYNPTRTLHDGDDLALIQRRNTSLHPPSGPRSLYRIQRTHSKTSTLHSSKYEDEQASLWDIKTIRSERSATAGSVDGWPGQRRRIEYLDNVSEVQEEPDRLSVLGPNMLTGSRLTVETLVDNEKPTKHGTSNQKRMFQSAASSTQDVAKEGSSDSKNPTHHGYSAPELMSVLKSLERLLDGEGRVSILGTNTKAGSQDPRKKHQNRGIDAPTSAGDQSPSQFESGGGVTIKADAVSSTPTQIASQKSREQSPAHTHKETLVEPGDSTDDSGSRERAIVSRQGTSNSLLVQGSRPSITSPSMIRIIDAKGRVIVEEVEEMTDDNRSDAGASYIDRSAQTTNITIDDVSSAVKQSHGKETSKNTRTRTQNSSTNHIHFDQNIPRVMRRPGRTTSNDDVPRKLSYERYRDWEYPIPRLSRHRNRSNRRRPSYDEYDELHGFSDHLLQNFDSRPTRHFPLSRNRRDIQDYKTRHLGAFWRRDNDSIHTQSHQRRAVRFASEDEYLEFTSNSGTQALSSQETIPFFHWDSYTMSRNHSPQGTEDEMMIKLLNEIDKAVTSHYIGRYYTKTPELTMEDFFSRQEFLDGILPDGDLNIIRDDSSRLGDGDLAQEDSSNRDDLSLSSSGDPGYFFGKGGNLGQCKRKGTHTPYPASNASSESDVHGDDDVPTQHNAWATVNEQAGSEWGHSPPIGASSHGEILMKRLVAASRQIIWSFTPKKGSSMIHILLKRFWGCVDGICRQIVWEQSEHCPEDERAYFIRNFSSHFKNTDANNTDSSSKRTWSDCQDCKSGKHYSTAVQALEHLHSAHIECDIECDERPYDDPCYAWLHHISAGKDHIRNSRDELLEDVGEFITYLLAIDKYVKDLHIMVINSGRDQPINTRVSRPPLSVNIIHTFQQIIKIFVVLSKRLSLANRLHEVSNSESSDSRMAKRIQAKVDELKLEEADTLEKTLDLLDSAKRDIFLSGNMSRDIEKLQPKTVGAEFLTLAFICVGQNLSHQPRSIARSYQKDIVMKIYKDYVSRLHFQANQRPQKRVFLDIRDLKEELEALDKVLEHQQNCLIRFVNAVYPETLRISTGTRVGQYKTESVYRDAQLRKLEVRRREVENMNTRSRILKEQVKQTIEILEEDHGKAIRVFTIVTLFFLPLSFVSSFMGMNTVDIRSTHYNQRLFWMTAIPVTVAVLALAFIYGYKGDDIRDWMVQRLQNPGSQHSALVYSKTDGSEDHASRYSEVSNAWQSTTGSVISGSNAYSEYKGSPRHRTSRRNGGNSPRSIQNNREWMRRQNTQDSLAPFKRVSQDTA